ncbi:hypothetical protein ACMYR2_2061 [Nitrobacter sp. TKz-YC01]
MSSGLTRVMSAGFFPELGVHENGSPSYRIIEPCASRRNPISGTFLKAFVSFGSPPKGFSIKSV